MHCVYHIYTHMDTHTNACALPFNNERNILIFLWLSRGVLTGVLCVITYINKHNTHTYTYACMHTYTHMYMYVIYNAHK